MGLERRCGIGPEDGDAVAGRNSEGLERGGEALDSVVEVAVGEAVAGVDDGEGVGVDGGGAGKEIQGRQRGDHGASEA